MTTIDKQHLADSKTPSARVKAKVKAKVKVWDIAVRLFHWSLVLSFAIAWFSAEVWDALHEYSGYIVGGLVVFRILWGLIGSRYARFRQFIYRPSMVFGYLRDSLAGKAKRYIGHNPAGGAMVIALLLSVAGVVISGIAMISDRFWGVEWVGEIHEVLSTFTLILIALHVAGVLYASYEHRENLIRSMITGLKKP